MGRKIRIKGMDKYFQKANDHSLLNDVREHCMNLGTDEMIEIYVSETGNRFPSGDHDDFDFVYETIEGLFSKLDRSKQDDVLERIRQSYDRMDIDWDFNYDPWEDDDDDYADDEKTYDGKPDENYYKNLIINFYKKKTSGEFIVNKEYGDNPNLVFMMWPISDTYYDSQLVNLKQRHVNRNFVRKSDYLATRKEISEKELKSLRAINFNKRS